MKTFRMASLSLALLATTFLLPSCRARYDPMGMENVTTLSNKLTTLMSKASTSTYDTHQSDLEMLSADLTKAEKHCADQKRNKEMATAWQVLRTEQVEPFLMRWKQGKLDKDFVKEATAQVQKSLDAIKKAEQGKSK